MKRRAPDAPLLPESLPPPTSGEVADIVTRAEIPSIGRTNQNLLDDGVIAEASKKNIIPFAASKATLEFGLSNLALAPIVIGISNGFRRARAVLTAVQPSFELWLDEILDNPVRFPTSVGTDPRDPTKKGVYFSSSEHLYQSLKASTFEGFVAFTGTDQRFSEFTGDTYNWIFPPKPGKGKDGILKYVKVHDIGDKKKDKVPGVTKTRYAVGILPKLATTTNASPAAKSLYAPIELSERPDVATKFPDGKYHLIGALEKAVWLAILKEKYSQNKDLRDILLATGDAYLMEENRGGGHWAASFKDTPLQEADRQAYAFMKYRPGMTKGKFKLHGSWRVGWAYGENAMGKYMMETRKHFQDARQKQQTELAVVPPPVARPTPRVVINSENGSRVNDWQVFLTRSEIDELVNYFEGPGAALLTQKKSAMGKNKKQPRYTATFADVPGLIYTYGQAVETSVKWPPVIENLKNLVSQATGSSYNFVLVNRYNDGTNNVGYHADDEPTIVPKTSIASVSLGATRTFLLKRNDATGRNGTISLSLQSGSLLEMAGNTQNEYKHSIPRTSTPVGVRYNLTFRTMYLDRVPRRMTGPAPVLFWKPDEVPYGLFSNWHFSIFSLGDDHELANELFYSGEQAIMAAKAHLFEDKDQFEKIMQRGKYNKDTTSFDGLRKNAALKTLGRKVKGYDDDRWAAYRTKLAQDICLARARAYPAIATLLRETGSRIIAEASPYDRIWGIGFKAADAVKAWNNGKKWGQNILGKAWEHTRSILNEQ